MDLFKEIERPSLPKKIEGMKKLSQVEEVNGDINLGEFTRLANTAKALKDAFQSDIDKAISKNVSEKLTQIMIPSLFTTEKRSSSFMDSGFMVSMGNKIPEILPSLIDVLVKNLGKETTLKLMERGMNFYNDNKSAQHTDSAKQVEQKDDNVQGSGILPSQLKQVFKEQNEALGIMMQEVTRQREIISALAVEVNRLKGEPVVEFKKKDKGDELDELLTKKESPIKVIEEKETQMEAPVTTQEKVEKLEPLEKLKKEEEKPKVDESVKKTSKLVLKVRKEDV